MSLLFEVTDLDFQLGIENSSFLDKTWTIPVRRVYMYFTVASE